MYNTKGVFHFIEMSLLQYHIQSNRMLDNRNLPWTSDLMDKGGGYIIQHSPVIREMQRVHRL